MNAEQNNAIQEITKGIDQQFMKFTHPQILGFGDFNQYLTKRKQQTRIWKSFYIFFGFQFHKLLPARATTK